MNIRASACVSQQAPPAENNLKAGLYPYVWIQQIVLQRNIGRRVSLYSFHQGSLLVDVNYWRRRPDASMCESEIVIGAKRIGGLLVYLCSLVKEKQDCPSTSY